MVYRTERERKKQRTSEEREVEAELKNKKQGIEEEIGRNDKKM